MYDELSLPQDMILCWQAEAVMQIIVSIFKGLFALIKPHLDKIFLYFIKQYLKRHPEQEEKLSEWFEQQIGGVGGAAARAWRRAKRTGDDLKRKGRELKAKREKAKQEKMEAEEARRRAEAEQQARENEERRLDEELDRLKRRNESKESGDESPPVRRPSTDYADRVREMIGRNKTPKK